MDTSDLTRDREWIVFLIGAGVVCLLFLPIMIYWWYRTYKYRHQSFISLRHPKILFFNCMLSCLCIAERLLALSRDLRLLQHSFYTILLRNVLYVLVFGIYIHSFLLRHWLLFYDLGYREAQVNIRWEHDLNLYRSHWFIEHRRNLGNFKFMLCLVFCCYVLVFVSLFLLQHLHSNLLWGIGISIYGVVLSVVFIVVSRKISAITASFMKKEMLYVGLVLLSTSIIYSLIINLIKLDELVLIVVSWAVSTSVPFLLHMMSTWYQIKSNTRSNRRQRLLTAGHLPKQKITLRDVLKDQAGFKLFIKHLIKDLCVENLIFLSYVIQFKTIYSFLVQKELEDKKTRSGIIEECDDEWDELEHENHLDVEQPPSVTDIRQKSHSADAEHSLYAVHHDEEYQSVYGWDMELPKWLKSKEETKRKNSSNILLSLYEMPNEQKSELIMAMYQESLAIYTRFIRVASKDEINISGKMRKSLKKYFEIEEIVTSTTNAILPGFTTVMTKVSRSNNEINAPAMYPDLGSNATASKESMNIRLTANDSLRADSIDFDVMTQDTLSPQIVLDDAISTPMDMEDDDIIIITDDPDEHKDDAQSPNDSHSRKNSKHRRAESDKAKTNSNGINRLSQKLSGSANNSRRNSRNTRKTRKEKTRFVIAQEPNDNYVRLDWMQRFTIFDKACDSIEKLLTIDSYGKFRESDEYVLFCQQMRKKSMSKTNLLLKKSSNMVGTMMREVRRKHNGVELQDAQSNTAVVRG